MAIDFSLRLFLYFFFLFFFANAVLDFVFSSAYIFIARKHVVARYGVAQQLEKKSDGANDGSSREDNNNNVIYYVTFALARFFF